MTTVRTVRRGRANSVQPAIDQIIQYAPGGGSGTGDVVGPGSSTTGNLPVFGDGSGKLLSDSGESIADVVATAVAAAPQGDVVGPASATDEHIALFDLTTGKLIKDGGGTILDVIATAAAAGAAAAPQGDVVGPGSAVDDRVAVFNLTTGKLIKDGGSTVAQIIAAGAAAAPQGNVVGPASAVDNRIALFDLTTGKLIKDGGSTIADVIAAALAAEQALDDAAWTSVAHGSLTFTAQTGSWTVDAGDLAYFKFKKEGSKVFLKGAITGSSVSSTPTELRVTVPGVTFAGNDSFGFTVFSHDGFGTQDCGQSICRVSSGLLVFKPRTGGTWTTTANQTAVIWNLVGECAP